MAETNWTLVQGLTLLNMLVLTVGLVFSVVAYRGFRDAPFGRILKPLPPMLVAFLLVNSPWVVWDLFDLPHFLDLYALFFSVAVVCAVWAALEAVFLLTERRGL